MLLDLVRYVFVYEKSHVVRYDCVSAPLEAPTFQRRRSVSKKYICASWLRTLRRVLVIDRVRHIEREVFSSELDKVRAASLSPRWLSNGLSELMFQGLFTRMFYVIFFERVECFLSTMKTQ